MVVNSWFRNFGVHGMAEKDFSIDSNNNAAPDSQLVLKKRARRRLVGAIALALLAVIVLPMVMDQTPQPLTQDIQIRIPNQDSGASTFVSRMAPKLAPTPTPLPQDAGKTATPADADAATPTQTPAAATVPVAIPPLAAETPSEAKTSSKTAPKHEVKSETKQDTKTAPPKAAAPAAPAHKTAVPIPASDKKSSVPVVQPTAVSTTEKTAESARAVALLNDEHWVVQLGAYRNAETVKSIATRIKALGLPAFTEKVDTPQGPSTRVRSGPFASRAMSEG